MVWDGMTTTSVRERYEAIRERVDREAVHTALVYVRDDGRERAE